MTCSCASTREAELEFDLELEQESEIIGPDARRLVRKTNLPPFRYICNLESGGVPFCSGTLIGPRTVFTAAHCLQGEDENGGVRIIPGRNGSSEPFGSTKSVKFVPMSGVDVAVVHLADPIGDSVGYWTRTYTKNKGDSLGTSILSSGSLPLPAKQLKVNLSGYPGDMPSDKKYACRDPKAKSARCTFNSGAGVSPLCGAFQYRSYDQSVTRSGRVLTYRNDTCAGHSGSPVWVRRHSSMGGRVLVAVHVSGGRKTNEAVFIDGDVLKFIIANTK